MKILHIFTVTLALIVAGSLQAAVNPATAPHVEVVFDHPENFRDIKDSAVPTDKGMDAILKAIRDYIVRIADPMLPKGYGLKIVFTDIDLAGDFEPWRGAQWDTVRIVKDIYPPAFSFSYSVTDGSGKMVKQGSENIRDLGFQFRAVMDESDPLRYEKDILRSWLSANLRSVGKP
jgi:hypothetical protein